MINDKWPACVKVLFVKLLFSAFVFTQGLNVKNIHDYLTNDEIRSIFNTDPDSVPEFEIAHVFHEKNNHHTRKVRSTTTEIHLRAFEQDITLYLEPTDHILLGRDTPVYTATKDIFEPLGIRYTKIDNVWPEDFRTYQDPNNQASVTMDKDSNGNMNINGILGNNMVIKPLPNRVPKKLGHFPIKGTGFKNNQKQSYNYNASPHVVYKTNDPITNIIGGTLKTSQAIWNSLFDFRLSNNRFKRSIFHTVYPQLLIMVDYRTYQAHGKDIKALAKYMAAFWNGVDLRYREISDPKVRLNIAGLVIPTMEGAAPYMEEHYKGRDLLEDKGTLEALSKYLHKEKRFTSDMYDIAVGITNLDMCMMESDFCNPASRGLGYNGGACKHDVRSSDRSVAVLEDTGGFSGIATAAHEVGHVLGAPHDGDDSLSYIGGPGAKKCNWNDGYLMSSLRHDSKGLHWSSCSKEAMSYFLKKEAYCLRNKPVVNNPIPKILPGKLISRDEQCRKTLNLVECKNRNNECGALFCARPHNPTNCITDRAPAEGSPCENGGICLDGQCVIEPKELIFLTLHE